MDQIFRLLNARLFHRGCTASVDYQSTMHSGPGLGLDEPLPPSYGRFLREFLGEEGVANALRQMQPRDEDDAQDQDE